MVKIAEKNNGKDALSEIYENQNKPKVNFFKKFGIVSLLFNGLNTRHSL